MSFSHDFGRPNRWRRATALGVAVVMFGSAQTAAAEAAAGGWHGLGWDLPPLQQTRSVEGKDGGLQPLPATTSKSTVPAAVNWPAAADADVDLPATGAAVDSVRAVPGQPVTVSRGRGRQQGKATVSAADRDSRAAGKVRVRTLDQAATVKTGIKGVLVQMTPVSGDTGGAVQVDVDYRSFGDAYGGDFGGRLHLVEYPSCLLSTPDRPAWSPP